MTRTAKRNSWKTFCEQVDSVNDVSKIKKFLSKTHTQAETMVDSEANRMETTEETIRLLMNAHFPPNPSISDDATVAREARSVEPKIDESMVRDAIKSFSPYKAAGPDNVFPALLQKEVDYISPYLAALFNACIRFAYTPKAWQEARVVFIPKPGKANYATPKSYRPISLTS